MSPGCWSNGKTLASHARNRSSTLRRSTAITPQRLPQTGPPDHFLSESSDSKIQFPSTDSRLLVPQDRYCGSADSTSNSASKGHERIPGPGDELGNGRTAGRGDGRTGCPSGLASPLTSKAAPYPRLVVPGASLAPSAGAIDRAQGIGKVSAGHHCADEQALSEGQLPHPRALPSYPRCHSSEFPRPRARRARKSCRRILRSDAKPSFGNEQGGRSSCDTDRRWPSAA